MHSDKPSHVLEAESRQDEIIRRMSPALRLTVARELYETAWRIKEASLRQAHPEWTDDQVRAKCRLIFITGYAGA